MVSGNAFSNASTNTTLSAFAADGAHINKRQKLGELEANIHCKTADSETALEVDHMILDYLAYRTTAATLASRKPQGSRDISLETNIDMTDQFLGIFKAKHPTYRADEALRFRLLLLKFSSLFTRRLRHGLTLLSPEALATLREANRDRAMSWVGSAARIPSSQYDVLAFDTELPLARESLGRNRAHVLHVLGAPAEDEAYEDAVYGTPTSLALLDLLPTFMAISAARNAISNSNLTQQWMHLAGNFMLQACLEQYLVRGSDGSDAIDEAFAWGCKPKIQDGEGSFGMRAGAEDIGALQLREQVDVDDMFEADDDGDPGESPSWTHIKTSYLAELFSEPSSTMDLSSYLETVASSHPIESFEHSVLNFLEALSASIPTPILTQLETGQLDGVSASDTQHFLERCGLSDRWPAM